MKKVTFYKKFSSKKIAFYKKFISTKFSKNQINREFITNTFLTFKNFLLMQIFYF